jgi:hypothetical protein
LFSRCERAVCDVSARSFAFLKLFPAKFASSTDYQQPGR